MVAEQELSVVFVGARGDDSDLERAGVGQVDGQLVVVAVAGGRCVLATTHRHAVAAAHSLLDHCVHLLKHAVHAFWRY